MKRQMLFGTMLSVALAIGVSAQTPATSPQGQSGQSQSPRTGAGDQPSSERTMTLTGCIEAGSGSSGAGSAAGGASTSASSQGSSAGFILTDVSAGGSSSAGAAAGTAGTSGAASSASRYRLSGGENLQQYVGKRVEVTGTVSGRAGSSATGAGGATSSPGAEAGAGAGAGAGASSSGASSASGMQTFRITSVKPATGDCK